MIGVGRLGVDEQMELGGEGGIQAGKVIGRATWTDSIVGVREWEG